MATLVYLGILGGKNLDFVGETFANILHLLHRRLLFYTFIVNFKWCF